MAGIVGIVALLVILALSLIITRLATTALTLTGLSREVARFQARSVFTGTGYSTHESESIVGHPVRRRVIMWLMIVRSAGLITIVLSLILSFLGTGEDESRLLRLGAMVVGVVALWLLANNRFVDRALNRWISRMLGKWTDLDTRDYASLLHVHGDYSVTELMIRDDDWLAGKQLSECHLREEGATVLGIIRRDRTYLGAPEGSDEIRPGDTLVLYGRADALAELDKRPANYRGEQAHREAVAEQRRAVAERKQQEQEHRRDDADGR